MGKNKGQKAKTKKEKAFTVINTKKTKTKTVAKNLKKMSFQSKAKTEKANERFKAVQEVLATKSAMVKKQGAKMVTRKPNVQQHKDTAADMEIATEDFAKL